VLDWSKIVLEDEVRLILRADGREPTMDEMKAWARAFVQERAPGWRPGLPLGWKDAERVGAAFALRLEHARRTRDPLGWVAR